MLRNRRSADHTSDLSPTRFPELVLTDFKALVKDDARAMTLVCELLDVYSMRVAIAHWQGRIAPVFDVAGNLLLVDVEGGVEQRRSSVVFDRDAPRLRVEQLARSGADVLICGAISWPLEMALRSVRVKVISQTCGEIETVLEAFIRGKLANQAFLMPGCPSRRQAARMRRRGCSKGGRAGARNVERSHDG